MSKACAELVLVLFRHLCLTLNQNTTSHEAHGYYYLISLPHRKCQRL